MQAYSIDYEKGKADFQNFDKQLPSPLKKTPNKIAPKEKLVRQLSKPFPVKGVGRWDVNMKFFSLTSILYQLVFSVYV